MKITRRDRMLLNDVALHHVMTREQIVGLGYFASLQRANARLLMLRKAGLLNLVRLNPSVETRQHLYAVSRSAIDFLDARIGSLLAARSITPRHVDHSLAVVDIRIKLLGLGMASWLAEPQVRHRYSIASGSQTRTEDFRPDGLARFHNDLVFVEADRGNVSLSRMKLKLASYASYSKRGAMKATYGVNAARLLIVTTGSLRKSHLIRIVHLAGPFSVGLETYHSLAARQTIDEVPFL